MPGKLILQYLAKIKQLISSGCWVLVPRKKNLDSLAREGLTVADAKNALLSLEIRDYQRGPELDYSYSGDVWVFKRTVESTEFYIKLKIDVANDGTEVLKCISFHS